MAFFMDSSITIGTKLLEVIYIFMGFMAIYTGVKNLRDKENKSPVGTCIFWCALGIVIAFGRWIPATVNGVLIVIMVIPAILQKVKVGKVSAPAEKEVDNNYKKIGMKIFLPALMIGICAIICALIPAIGALTGCGIGVILAAVILMLYSRDNKPTVFLNDSERLLSTVGPLSMLPMLLASLGAVFTAAGVGDVIARTYAEYFADKDHRDLFYRLLDEVEIIQEEVSEDSRKFEGVNFVITGSVEHFANRAEVKEEIEKRGGKVTGSVTSKTNFLINNDVNSTSSKNRKARELGVRIISEGEFLEMLSGS